jgi:putative tributyrin esterase
VVRGFFRLSERGENTFVTALSMGGYGALQWALRQPQRFAAAASLSGTLNLAARAARRQSWWPSRLQNIFGERPVGRSDTTYSGCSEPWIFP